MSSISKPGLPLDLSRRFPGFDACPTPQVVVDAEALAGNIARMAEITHGKAALHPHVKTHKSLAIAAMQREAGAAGFTAARANEAEMILRAGLGPVTLAYPMIDPAEARRLLERVGEGELRFIADSPQGVSALARAAADAGRQTKVLVKVDVGLHRCGVDPHGEAAHALARQIDDASHLVFAGLLSHAGHAYGAGDPNGIRAVARQELDLMAKLRDSLRRAGIEVPIVSVGSTPTLIANAGFDGVDQVRPGNYAFLDLTAVRLGIAARDDVALGIAARIVSANGTYAIAGIGSKTLSSDRGAHGTSGTSSYGEAWIEGAEAPFTVEKLSEEHAFLRLGCRSLPIGTPVLILPNHSCPVANLSGGLLLLARDEPPRLLSIDARSNSAGQGR
ncbi:alanine racemase [Mesorhizobium sp. J428]|uniref:alanine racemase n=1 Tax=Mesorhizobium sp. J428 TaxID=2898440 RepID=UPI002151ECB6|nr:alanine racemase [Mesorhizobium sp. J428]MCR5856184.1 alanine racemase [Mesorhizobium sp. J428]